MKVKTKIPVSREILVDMETPLSVYRKLANGPYSYLFESVEGGENWARYSLIGLEASKIIFLKKNQIEIHHNGEIIENFFSDDPLGYIDELQKSFELKQNDELPIFNGGLVGYFGYDCV
ncbi:MAG TPA: anthranilate synthase component I, partial [SAR86 cluster bacterium]|nr:anthranilate synthase component I [SAR86 cluster bacterium]